MRALSIAALAAALSVAAAPGLAAPAAPSSTVEGVTVSGQRAGAAERKRVDAYVQQITAGHPGESLTRWREPVCPLIAGLKTDQAEAMLTRISQVAKDVGAPLAAQGHCRANFFVVVTAQPKPLLEGWSQHDLGLFADMGAKAMRRIIDTDRPARVWHNAMAEPTDGRNEADEQTGIQGVPQQRGEISSHLVNNTERHTRSVVIVIDTNRAHGVTLAQLADYAAMTGLAEIDLDAPLGDAPSILQLFAKGPAAPVALSRWDTAFLKGLYRVPQRNRTQRSEIASYVVEAVSQ
jgi:hypothetical protein